jgi:hypothetical protein
MIWVALKVPVTYVLVLCADIESLSIFSRLLSCALSRPATASESSIKTILLIFTVVRFDVYLEAQSTLTLTIISLSILSLTREGILILKSSGFTLNSACPSK